MLIITRKRKKQVPKKKDYTKLYLSLIIVVIFIFSIATYLSIANNNNKQQEWGDAPDFTVTTLDHGKLTLSDHIGKIILIDFTAKNCGWCNEGGYDQYGNKIQGQIYELLDLYEQVGSDVVFISIDSWYHYETEDDLRDMKEGYGAEWYFAMDDAEIDISGSYEVEAIPKLVLIDKNGNVYYSNSGLDTKEQLLQEINKKI